MAIISVYELWDGRRGEDGIERKRKYTRRFEVRTDDPFDDATVVGGSALLPRNGDLHPGDPGAYMVRINPEQSSDDPTLWYVSCEYDTELPKVQGQESQSVDSSGNSTPNPSPTQRPENPLDRSPVYKCTFEQTTEITAEDKDGNPIKNSAGDPFDPPLSIERSYPVITITKNVAGINFANLKNYQDAVNQFAWRSFTPRQCRIVGIDFEPASENNVSFWRVTFRIKVRYQKWDRRVLDAGFYEFIPGSVGMGTPDQRVRIFDKKVGGYPADPQLLDGFGKQKAPNAAPVFLTFYVYREVDFATLGI